MDILDALRLATSADLYRLHLTVARLLALRPSIRNR
jgi:hypothetical protein